MLLDHKITRGRHSDLVASIAEPGLCPRVELQRFRIELPGLAKVMADQIVWSWCRLLPMDNRKSSWTDRSVTIRCCGPAFDRFHGFRELFIAGKEFQRALLIRLGQGYLFR
ncbi:MAG: hypothetical protein CM15mP77_2460 [Synechococcus sp.]|nr:MAG: hypothetical protein CM15mP77_2460 [Synechococcus sp.]